MLKEIAQEVYADGRGEHSVAALVHTLQWADLALTQLQEGEALLEIGVREGHTSEALCRLVAARAPASTRVLSVDPWGSAPYGMGETRWDPSPYDQAMACRAKARLAPYPQSLVFPITAAGFFTLAPWLQWYHAGKAYPREECYLRFVFLDGVHTVAAVEDELRYCWSLLAPGGVILLDDVDLYAAALASFSAWVRPGEVRWLLSETTLDTPPPGRPRRSVLQKVQG